MAINAETDRLTRALYGDGPLFGDRIISRIYAARLPMFASTPPRPAPIKSEPRHDARAWTGEPDPQYRLHREIVITVREYIAGGRP